MVILDMLASSRATLVTSITMRQAAARRKMCLRIFLGINIILYFV